MTLLELCLLLVVAGICGSLAQTLTGYSHGGCLTSIVLGFIGAMIGRWLAGLLGIGEFLSVRIGDRPFPIVWSILGAAMFVAVLHLLRPRTAG